MLCMKKPVRPRIAIDCDEVHAVAMTLMKVYTGKTPREAFLHLVTKALEPYMAEAQKMIDKRKKSEN